MVSCTCPILQSRLDWVIDFHGIKVKGKSYSEFTPGLTFGLARFSVVFLFAQGYSESVIIGAYVRSLTLFLLLSMGGWIGAIELSTMLFEGGESK